MRVEEKECNSHVIYRIPSGRKKRVFREGECGVQVILKGSASAGFAGAGQNSNIQID